MSEVTYNPDASTEAPTEIKQEKPSRSLAKFLSHKGTDPDTMELYISSIDDSILIKELSGKEMEKVIDMQTSPKISAFEVACELVAMTLIFPDLRDEHVRDKFVQHFNNGDPMSNSEIVRMMFKPGEISAIAERVFELSGGMEDAVREAKN